MLKWLKDAVVQQLVAEVRRNAQRFDTIIELLREQTKTLSGLGLMPERLEIIHGLIFDLTRKVEQQMSELSDAVAAIANDVTELQAAQQRVIDLLTKPNPDVQSAVAALQNADAGFDAVRDALNAAGATPSEAPPASSEG